MSAWASSFEGVLFDMDGTLVDTEMHTDTAIHNVLTRHGIEDGSLKPELTAGRTWSFICETLISQYPLLNKRVELNILEDELVESWTALAQEGAEEIPGACHAVVEASRHMAVGVVSGSPRKLVDHLIGHLGLCDRFPLKGRIGGDEVGASKPDPEGFLLSASRLGIDPSRCLVFEDSIAGLQAANAAGATSVAILHSCKEPDVCRAEADCSIEHFQTLPFDFWATVARS